MPLAPGVNLGLLMRTADIPDELSLALQVERLLPEALGRLHNAGYIHNDVRTFNITVDIEETSIGIVIKKLTVRGWDNVQTSQE
jgi:tRNA A-37 threonylcarbamoyl transferase component Bud32